MVENGLQSLRLCSNDLFQFSYYLPVNSSIGQRGKRPFRRSSPTAAHRAADRIRDGAADHSAHLAKAESDNATERAGQMGVVVGDVRRTVGLSADRLRMLEIAAKGAVDRSMEGWRSAQENQVRQQAVRPAAGDGGAAARDPWAASSSATARTPTSKACGKPPLGQVLTPRSAHALDRARRNGRPIVTRALVAMLLAELDRQLGVTLTQRRSWSRWPWLRCHDYMPDMMNYIDRSSGIDLRMLLLHALRRCRGHAQDLAHRAATCALAPTDRDYRGWWQSVEPESSRPD